MKVKHYATALIQLPLVKEATKQRITCSKDVADYCQDMANIAQECVHILLLNSKNFVIERSAVAIGTLDSASVHAREVFRLAIEFSARSILMVHNHPSGDPAPSREDISLTKQMIEAGKVVGINLLDHVIIGRKTDGHAGHVSIRDDGLCEF